MIRRILCSLFSLCLSGFAQPNIIILLADDLGYGEAEADLQARKDSAKAKMVAGDPLTAEEADTLVL